MITVMTAVHELNARVLRADERVAVGDLEARAEVEALAALLSGAKLDGAPTQR
jgi:hypothetical protein